MVSLGFFNVAGQNDLPFVSSDLDTSNEVQSNLLSYAARLDPANVGVRAASVWNLPLCVSCLTHEAYPSAALYNKPVLQAQSERLAASVASGLSTAELVKAWTAGPEGGGHLGASCASACAPLEQTFNFYAGGFERPYGGRELPL